DHAGKGARRARVDSHDARGGVGAPHDAPVEHAGERQVAGVDRPAAHLLPRVGTRGARADHAMGHTSQPPSTVTAWPVMLDESSETRNSTALAMSCATVTRLSAISSTYS